METAFFCIFVTLHLFSLSINYLIIFDDYLAELNGMYNTGACILKCCFFQPSISLCFFR